MFASLMPKVICLFSINLEGKEKALKPCNINVFRVLGIVAAAQAAIKNGRN